MKLNKYIIKNCPACIYYAGVYCCEDNHDTEGRDTYCENIDNCVMKQIYEKCENTIIQNPNQEDDTFEFDVGRESLGTEIIGLLDIEEAER